MMVRPFLSLDENALLFRLSDYAMRQRLADAVPRVITPILLASCLALGGASAAGHVANAVLQLIALACIVAILSRREMPRLPTPAIALLGIYGLAATIMVMQLVPLPPSLWHMLPGHRTAWTTLGLARVDAPWAPISLAPEATLGCLLSLLPPVAITLSVFSSDALGRRYSFVVVVAVSLGSIALGIAQIFGGENSSLYPYAITNRGSAVGLFANRNHLATLLLSSLPVLTALIDTRRDAPRRMLHLGLVGAGILILSLGVVLIGSRAGLGLLLPTLAVTLLFMLRNGESRRMGMRHWVLAAILPCLAALAFGASLPENGDTKGSSLAALHRPVIVATTLRAARDYLPWGSGGGSFRTVYPAYEDPAAVSLEYVNHAHCDPAELALEYGVPGLLVAALTLLLLASRAGPAWQLAGRAGTEARAALAILAIIVLSGFVDYPMRTAAVASLAAMAAAMVAMPRPVVRVSAFGRQRGEREPHRLAISTDEM